jgi:hypothetical protein
MSITVNPPVSTPEIALLEEPYQPSTCPSVAAFGEEAPKLR